MRHWFRAPQIKSVPKPVRIVADEPLSQFSFEMRMLESHFNPSDQGKTASLSWRHARRLYDTNSRSYLQSCISLCYEG